MGSKPNFTKCVFIGLVATLLSSYLNYLNYLLLPYPHPHLGLETQTGFPFVFWVERFATATPYGTTGGGTEFFLGYFLLDIAVWAVAAYLILSYAKKK